MSAQFGFGSAGSSPPPIDFHVSFHGSVAAFTPLTPAARGWVKENVQAEPRQWLGRATLIVDHRFVQPLLSVAGRAGAAVSRYVRSGGKVVKRPRRAPVTWRFWLTLYVIGAALDWLIRHIEQITYVQVLAFFALVIAGCVMWLRRHEREARKEEHGDGEGQPTAVAHLPSTDEAQGLKEGERCW